VLAGLPVIAGLMLFAFEASTELFLADKLLFH
jgi:hypothetical protein